MSWQSQIFDRLRDREWHTIGELFDLVCAEIPLHTAMRHAMQPQKGRVELPSNNEARWRLFLGVLSSIKVECDGGKGWKYTDRVRLRYVKDRACEDCGGPVIRETWMARSRVVCLACAVPKVELAPLPVERPRLVLVPKVLPPPPRPPERRQKTIDELGTLSSLKEMWNEFALTAADQQLEFPKLDGGNRKLRWTLHRALEAGAADEFKRLSLFRTAELFVLQFPRLDPMTEVLKVRAAEWIVHKTPALTRAERVTWVPLLSSAFWFGAVTIVSITAQDRLAVISDEMDKLVAKLEPRPQRPRGPPKQRWRQAFRKLTRWRMN